ncbi:hypothetical protein Ais01nite_64070 [Asanoa ishikariensis]|uniref:Barstar (Barnase inhibitor) n=1 Tax=Asanoa ishikariensis TaxID=137265 RepID=A0A1H3NUK1_9ACTN|nr:barstar family protein [Asanoa ishikariensis]GIF68372.1 hypothetical protein Ais01nite_64070 [Asanoa ishikariensis]SDY92125.1 Barstar (barnase inhibitor) [Asanoa ishikariensis]
MAAFDADTDLSQDRAYLLMRNSPATLFWRRELLEDTTAWLTVHGYQVTVLDASGWWTDEDMHRAVAAALSFPDYYGRNLDALNDCMRDVVSQDYGWAAGTTGLAIVFTGYDAFATHRPREAHVVLDILADHSRAAALLGRRLMCLVQSDDPKITFPPVGATAAQWNDAEWADSRRR